MYKYCTDHICIYGTDLVLQMFGSLRLTLRYRRSKRIALTINITNMIPLKVVYCKTFQQEARKRSQITSHFMKNTDKLEFLSFLQRFHKTCKYILYI